MQRKIIAQIEDILFELDMDAKKWVEANIPKAYRDGQALTILALGEVKTIEQATKAVSFSRLNRQFVDTMINDTFSDLLQATQNTRRQVKQTIREVVSEQMRSKAAQNLGRRTMTRDIVSELRDKLADAGKFAIRDRAGRAWSIKDYADVVVRTKIMDSHIEGKRNEAIERGSYYGVISTHHANDACRFHEGRIVKLVASAPGDYPTIEELRASGQIFHVRCRHSVTPLRDPELLPQAVRETAESQAELGNTALATGKRNPTDIE